MNPSGSCGPYQTASALLLGLTFCLTGCSGTPAGSSPPTLPAAATLIYTRSNDSKTVLAYPANATGNASPTSTLSLPDGDYIDTIATDSAGEIYVGVQGSDVTVSEILIFPAGSSGPATPSRTITVPQTIYPWVMAVDAAGLLYVATQVEGSVPPVINVYSATANGPSAPIRTINLPASGPLGLSDATVDAAGNLYVATASSLTGGIVIEVFDPAASGLATPSRTIIAGAGVSGVAVDAAGDIFANVNVGNGTTSNIEEFAPGANGQATPLRTINLSARSEFLRVDPAGNVYTSEQLITSYPTPSYSFQIQAFSPNATGTATPFASFAAVGGIAQQLTLN